MRIWAPGTGSPGRAQTWNPSEDLSEVRPLYWGSGNLRKVPGKIQRSTFYVHDKSKSGKEEGGVVALVLTKAP